MDNLKYERFINFVVDDITNRVNVVFGAIKWATHSFPEVHTAYIRHQVNILTLGGDNAILNTFELGFHRYIIDRYGIKKLEVRGIIMQRVCEKLKDRL